MKEEEIITLKDEETGKEYKMVKTNPLKNYSFCPQCKIIRGEDVSPTYLVKWEETYFNSWGMCRTCFDFINDHKGDFKEFSGNVKLDENGQIELVKGDDV